MAAKKTFNFEFVDAQYFQSFMLWIDHKRQIGKGYKTQMSIEICYKHLIHISGSGDKALQVVHQSIANNWQGLFPLKQNKYESVSDKAATGIELAKAALAKSLNKIATSRGLNNSEEVCSTANAKPYT